MIELSKARYVFLISLLFLTTSLVIAPKIANAHEGHDHGAEQTETTQSGQTMIARAKRAEDFEVTLKHPALEPDKELLVRLMITRYETNEPVSKAKVVLAIDGNNSPIEIVVMETSTPGLYELKLPPMPQGDYKIKARLEVSGNLATANFGTIQVKPMETEQPVNGSLWARTALIAIGALFLIAIITVLIFAAVKYVRRERHIEEETVTI